MDADDQHMHLSYPQLGRNRPPGLDRGKVKRGAVDNLHMILHQQRIAMPTKAVRSDRDRDGAIGAVVRNEREGQGARPGPEATIGFLQGNDIGVELGQHLENAVGASASVKADCLSDIIARDAHQMHPVAAQAAFFISIRSQISTSAPVRATIISALCEGPGVKRSRSVPRGTVG